MNPPGIPWSGAEAAAINDFLNSPLGRKWMGVLLTRKPQMDLSTTERAALSGAYAAGYERIFGEIAATRVATTQDSASMKGIDATKD
jgi:hypothetical protein